MDQTHDTAADKRRSPDRSGADRMPPRRDLFVALACGATVGLMVGAAFAAVPLYDWFCRVTGFGGTPQVASVGPEQVLDRKVKVRFDANISHDLPWRFEPEVKAVDVRIGEVVTVYYSVTNKSAHATVGTASYNVTPPQTGGYFAKVNCFCFTEQHLGPGEKRDMAVVFFVDPSLADDSDQQDLNTITLSYTFFPVDAPQQDAASNEGVTASGRI